MIYTHAHLVALTLFALSIGSRETVASVTENTYDGVYISGFETSAFEPCDGEEVYWLELSNELSESESSRFWDAILKYQSPNEINGDLSAFLFLSVEGKLSQKGEYGHLGGYDRELSASKLHTIRVATLDEIQSCVNSSKFGYLGDAARKD